MAKFLMGKGITKNTIIGSPPKGFKWILKWAMITLYTSTTTGSRTTYLNYILVSNSPYSGCFTLAQISTSSTQIIVSGIGGVINQIGCGATSLIQYYQYPEIFDNGEIFLNPVLQSGDTVDYYIMVEEVVA